MLLKERVLIDERNDISYGEVSLGSFTQHTVYVLCRAGIDCCKVLWRLERRYCYVEAHKDSTINRPTCLTASTSKVGYNGKHKIRLAKSSATGQGWFGSSVVTSLNEG